MQTVIWNDREWTVIRNPEDARHWLIRLFGHCPAQPFWGYNYPLIADTWKNGDGLRAYKAIHLHEGELENIIKSQ